MNWDHLLLAIRDNNVSTHRSRCNCTQGLQRLILSWYTYTLAAPVPTSAVPEALVSMDISGLMLAGQVAHLPMLLPGRPLATQRPALSTPGENQAHAACAASPVHAHRSLTDSRGSDMCRPPAWHLLAGAGRDDSIVARAKGDINAFSVVAGGRRRGRPRGGPLIGLIVNPRL